MDLLVFLGCFAGIFLFLIYKGTVENKRKIEKLSHYFKEHFGKANDRQWKNDELGIISHYSEKRRTKKTIDDLTWNDLDMDCVFKQMAYTRSSLGDDYLYDMLKNPVMKKETLLERENKISFLENREDIRNRLQVLFARLGRMKKYSFSDYLDYLMKEDAKSNGKHYLTDGLILLSLVLMGFHVGYGLAAFFIILLYNVVTYFKDKAYLEPYLTSLRYLLKILEYGRELLKLLPAEWEKEKKQLQSILKSMENFRRHSFLLMSPGRMTGEGLELILDYLRMCLHLDIIKFNMMVSEIHRHQEELWQLYQLMGEIDACIAIGEYREFLPKTCCPVFYDKQEIRMKEGYHSLIENAVANSVELKKNMLLTGSNASGKSTFLRTMGINILLAQTIHTCTAESFCLPFCRLYTSMSLKDSISLKESYYMAEIKAIKRILDSAREEETVVCMVDEVLRGTNTIERIAASTQILKGMANGNIICLAATHDVELTRTLEKDYDNYHFEESLVKGDVAFSYRLKKGRAESCNAIDLLASMGYEPELIRNARKMISDFEQQGEWICE